MSVIVSLLHPGHWDGEFGRSLVNLMWRDKGRLIDGWLPIPTGPNLATARNRQARTFLGTDSEWLWIVDSDMAFQENTLDLLVEAANPQWAPIVGALCFGQKSVDGTLVFYPTLYQVDDDGAYRVDDYPADQMFQVSATGTACLLIHRSVLEKMQANYPEPFPWFAEEINEWGGLNSEDVTFCLRAGELGFPVHVHTGIKTGHSKRFLLTEDLYLSAKER